LRLDPAAVATYAAAMDRVAEQISGAAGTMNGAAITARLVAELGEVGADFAADFGQIVDAHAAEWAVGGHLVSEYGKVMQSFAAVASAVDDELAAAIRRGAGRE
jgi:hypothetical protein